MDMTHDAKPSREPMYDEMTHAMQTILMRNAKQRVCTRSFGSIDMHPIDVAAYHFITWGNGSVLYAKLNSWATSHMPCCCIVS